METPPLLTEEQQRITVQQKIYEASLLVDGATINALGNLVITDAQYEELHDYMEHAPDLETWLETDIEEVYRRTHKGSVDNYLLGALKRRGLTTVRSILAVGQDRAHSGELGSPKLAEMMDNDFGITLSKDAPDAVFIASICESLGQVPGKCIHNRVKAGVSVENIWAAIQTGDKNLEWLIDWSHKDRRDRTPIPKDSKQRIIQDIAVDTFIFMSHFKRAKGQYALEVIDSQPQSATEAV